MLTIRNASLNMSIHNGKKTSPLDSPNLNLLTANNGILELAEKKSEIDALIMDIKLYKLRFKAFR